MAMDQQPATIHEALQPTALLDDTEHPPNCGAFFPNAQHFVVEGGSFTSVMHNHNHTHLLPSVPANLRTIPLGDIDLLRDIQVDPESGYVDRSVCGGRVCVRRMFTARVGDRAAEMTVAMYQGDNAEEEWRRDISAHSWLRHPNFVQMYGAASAGGVHAAVFYDDLLPVEQFWDLCDSSLLTTVHLYAYCDTEFKAARRYFQSVSNAPLRAYQCTFYIRLSTGRLCAELRPSDSQAFLSFLPLQCPPNKSSFLPGAGIMALHGNGPYSESAVQRVMAALTVAQYQEVCYWYLSGMRVLAVTVPGATVRMGAVLRSSSRSAYVDLEEIHPPSELEVLDTGWNAGGGPQGVLMPSGWTRYDVRDAMDVRFHRSVQLSRLGGWLGQANMIFTQLGINDKLEDHVVVDVIEFWLALLPAPNALSSPSTGYLFVCPASHLECGSAHAFRVPPHGAAYWARDPAGLGRMTTAEATYCGLPTVRFEMRVHARFWDARVYAGLRLFHAAEDFDTDMNCGPGYPRYTIIRTQLNGNDSSEGDDEDEWSELVSVSDSECESATAAVWQDTCSKIISEFKKMHHFT